MNQGERRMNAQSAIDKTLPAQLIKLIEQENSKPKAARLCLFASQYFAVTGKAELFRRSVADLYETLERAWQFFAAPVSQPYKMAFSDYNEGRQRGDNEFCEPGTTLHLVLPDRPFLVDSLRQQLIARGYNFRSLNNAVLNLRRNTAGRVQTLYSASEFSRLSPQQSSNSLSEAMIDLHFPALTRAQQKEVKELVIETLDQIIAATDDFIPMCETLRDIAQRLKQNQKLLPVALEDYQEANAFISWLLENHFTFLGYEKYQINHDKKHANIKLDKPSMLGVSKFKPDLRAQVALKELPRKVVNHILAPQVCGFAKSATRSKVHRYAYYDYVLIKEFDSKGRVILEHRFLGLYTSSVYFRDVLSIPMLRQKVSAVLSRSGFSRNGHNIKDLEQVINVLPRDELFQMNFDELFDAAMQITQIQETRRTRLFIRADSYGRYFSCLAYVPRHIYSTEIREQISRFLLDALGASDVDFNVYFSESAHARVHFIIRSENIDEIRFDVEKLESQLVERIKPWEDRFADALMERFSELDSSALFDRYQQCFPVTFKESYSVEEAVDCIDDLENAVAFNRLQIDFSEIPTEEIAGCFSFKIFSPNVALILSDVAPILENMGCQVVSESSFALKHPSDSVIHLHDFILKSELVGRTPLAEFRENFEQAFLAVWDERADNDSFNGLILSASMSWREVALLRAYSAYMKQLTLGYSQEFTAATLLRYGDLTGAIFDFFSFSFDPALAESKRTKLKHDVHAKAMQAIDNISNLSEDNMLRTFFALVEATLRTNYFQKNEAGEDKSYYALKIQPGKVPGMPLPKPQFEIFVFSPLVEGVHLRGGKVARGGLRWSDRHEDYRTEVLGLVKAQQVKNSVIVPVGAKGGFVVKKPIAGASRAELMDQGIDCYKTFISALLDVTDNIVDGKLIPPVDVVRKDDDDSYLVVAADKGTATFSDIANGIAQSRGFWLGDGFASGGSNGYDHKKMGITAKGAWVSVQRHFREIGLNVQKQEFTVVGIGDMSGDVFGNGMLLSRDIRLVAAFNHLHIFVDPNPDAAKSFKERQRLFRKDRSSWTDFNEGLISKGGAVFSRSSKSIDVTPQMQERFDISAKTLTPDQLITALLKSPVDLLWNGGIGTYVKAKTESHAEVGDKANDSLRVNGHELRCKVIGEGGNLGFTQRARIEFARNGGTSFTDFIDNSAGVDCSDHEVNIKILLSQLTASGKLKASARNKLLAEMTDNVSELVLDNNYRQVQSLGFAQSQSKSRTREFAGLLSYLEQHAGLDRQIEFLPSAEEVEERLRNNESLTRPELAVLTSYMKMFLKEQLAAADYIGDSFLTDLLHSAFPSLLVQKYRTDIARHPLRKEIVATQLANEAVNSLGASFVYRLADSSGAAPAEIVRAATIARKIYDVDSLLQGIESLDYKVSSTVQNEMMEQVVRLMRRATRWLLRNRRSSLEFENTIRDFERSVKAGKRALPSVLSPGMKHRLESRSQYLQDAGVPEDLALAVASCEYAHSLTSVTEVTANTGVALKLVLEVFFGIGDSLKLNWLASLVNQLPVTSYWQALARESFQDDIDWQQRALSQNIVASARKGQRAGSLVEQWSERHAASIERSKAMLIQLERESQAEYPMFSVTLRELLNLAQSTAYDDLETGENG